MGRESVYGHNLRNGGLPLLRENDQSATQQGPEPPGYPKCPINFCLSFFFILYFKINYFLNIINLFAFQFNYFSQIFIMFHELPFPSTVMFPRFCKISRIPVMMGAANILRKIIKPYYSYFV